MAADKDAILTGLAKEFKGRLSKCQHYDANVCTWRVDPQTPWMPIDGDPLVKRLRFSHRNRKVTCLSNGTYISADVAGTFATGVFSLNAKNRIGFRSKDAGICEVGRNGWPVFTENGSLSLDQSNLLRCPELASLLNEVGLHDGESVHFSNGDIKAYLRFPNLDRLRATIERLIDLAGTIEVLEEELDLSPLPSEFHPLIPLIRKWAISDDVEREELIETMKDAELKGLLREIEPYLVSIDRYLNSFEDSEPAAALGCLAELAIEIRLKLEGTPGMQ